MPHHPAPAPARDPTPDDSPDDARTEQRLTDLEIKLGFTEDLVDHLNALVARQQAQIDVLMRELLGLREQVAESAKPAFRSLRDELPPHY